MVLEPLKIETGGADVRGCARRAELKSCLKKNTLSCRDFKKLEPEDGGLSTVVARTVVAGAPMEDLQIQISGVLQTSCGVPRGEIRVKVRNPACGQDIIRECRRFL